MKDKVILSYRAKSPEERLAIQMIKDCHCFLEKKLKIETNLLIDKVKLAKKHPNSDARGIWFPEKQTVVINMFHLKGCQIKECIEVLGHEMRHALQYKRKWLIRSKKDNEVNYWKGKKYLLTLYYKQPWEIDARKWEKKYSDMAIDSLGLHKKSKIKLGY